MSLNKYCFIILLLLASCKNTTQETGANNTLKQQKINPLIEVDDLWKELEQNKPLTIIDFRKKEAFELGHLPKATQLWRSDIESVNYPYKGMMATKEQTEILFSKLGIRPTDKLVIYDDRGSCDAARLWWLVKTYGFEKVQILNGGVQAWSARGYEITTAKNLKKPTKFEFEQKMALPLLVKKEELLQLQKNPNYVILDTRTIEEFSGKKLKKGAKKAGRIINSINLDWSRAINYNGDGKFKSKKELENIYSSLFTSKEDPIIVYCHTGVRSAHTTFVLSALLGYENVRNYDGSWTEWSHFDDYPFEKENVTLTLQ